MSNNTQGKDFAGLAMLRTAAKIQRVYLEAYKDINDKLKEHTKKFKALDKEMVAKAKAGEITWGKYQAWKKKNIFDGNHWQRMKDQMINQMFKAGTTATKMINGERQAVFLENVNYTEYQIDKDFKFGVSFEVYDSATVTRLIKDDPELLPPVYLDEEKQMKWNSRVINSAITQSIIQGETMQQTANRIAKKLVNADENSLMRLARTAMTSAQNSGRIEAMHNAMDKGIEVEKVWIATLDNRTRESHGDLDGQTQKVDDPFISILGEINYPGDPDADPANVYNCRCSLGWDYPEYRNQYDTRAAREYDGEEDEKGHTVEVPYMTYKDWKALNGNGTPKSNPLPKPNNANNQNSAPTQSTIQPTAQPKEEKQKEPELSEQAKSVIKKCEDNKIAYKEVTKLDKDWVNGSAEEVEKEIIKRISGGDMTTGSCASLSFAYIGNKCGYDVLDYRGGISQQHFSRKNIIEEILRMDGCVTKEEKHTNDITAANRLLGNMEIGKEYILITGQHAAIVRKKDESTTQYLELQSERNSGWQTLNKDELKWRFGCKQSHTRYGQKREVSSYLSDVDSFKNVDGFDRILGYINTSESEQKKGAKGHER